MRVLGRRDSAPSAFSWTSLAAPETMLNLKFALAQSDPAGLEQALYDVSDPKSANYGNHLTKEDAAAFVAPSNQTVATINKWLANHNLTANVISPAGDWLSLQVPVSQANDLFAANFSVFTHDTTGNQAVRTLSYSVPESLVDHLKVIYPTTTFPSMKSLVPIFSAPEPLTSTGGGASGVTGAGGQAVAASCDQVVTPTCLQTLYGIPATAATNQDNQLAVSGFIEQFANGNDLQLFLANLRTDADSATKFTLQTLDGGQNLQSAQQAGVEANLDIQYTVGVATGVPTTFISVGEQNSDGDLGGFLDIINFLLNEDAPPAVLTTSYGNNEEDIPIAMADNLCNAYAQLGARGVSILFASGDGGVSGSQASQCTEFVPTFPSGCPYLTSVGATQGISPETAADFSSGGFSNYFGIPAYQQDAVAAYLKTLGTTNKGLFNASGRAYPDVSTQGVQFEVVVGGQATGVDGTSCASPVFASVVALLNDQLTSAGKSPLGFLNPFLYSTAASALNDVTTGSNPGCNTNGFPAAAGWDPVTGLGTPNFDALKTAAGL
ncbi:hypothetical protein FOMPIDRAFT_1135359 [Fomitopsis schrenkii]|uniref:tripeptidyl-peptidase II n=1 Tax=Fomitopsis schrenkii TaxID=2126942 RepID=S8DMK5_FOMSC|nr:hypothetical protein FOMPIDRAFT_1135359 [Fomitopsis schrenkii]